MRRPARASTGTRRKEEGEADWIVISFPAQNLVGKKADIYGNYSAGIRQAAEERGWELTEELFENEMLVIIRKLSK